MKVRSLSLLTLICLLSLNFKALAGDGHRLSDEEVIPEENVPPPVFDDNNVAHEIQPPVFEDGPGGGVVLGPKKSAQPGYLSRANRVFTPEEETKTSKAYEKISKHLSEDNKCLGQNRVYLEAQMKLEKLKRDIAKLEAVELNRPVKDSCAESYKDIAKGMKNLFKAGAEPLMNDFPGIGDARRLK